MVYFKTTPYETEENWEIIQERDLKKSCAGKLLQGISWNSKKIGKFLCNVASSHEHTCSTQLTDTVKQMSVRVAANKDGGAVRRTGSSCARCRPNNCVF